MGRSITNRYITTYLLLNFILFSALVVVFSTTINRYFVEKKQNDLLTTLESFSTEYVMSYYNQSEESLLENELAVLAKHLNTRIWIIDPTRVIHIDSDLTFNSVKDKRIESEYITRALAGETLRETGKFTQILGEETLSLIVPITIEGNIKGAIAIHSSTSTLSSDTVYIFRVVILGIIISLLSTVLINQWFATSFTQPFKILNNAARALANGDLTTRIDLKRADEFGDFAANMNYMAEELEKLEDFRKTFIANISHDFRSPLTSIKGFAQAISDGTIPKDRETKYLQVIIDESDRLTKLTSNILFLTEMDSNKIRLEIIEFDIHEMIRKMVLRFEPKLLSKEIDIHVMVDPNPLLVRADMENIERVLQNLFDNAIKFCRKSDSITIETSHSYNHVIISVKDTGPGIPKSHLPYIFDRFHKVDQSRGKDKKGTGLGLAIVKQIIKAHGEEIQVYSQEGYGAEFTFTLAAVEYKKV